MGSITLGLVPMKRERSLILGLALIASLLVNSSCNTGNNTGKLSGSIDTLQKKAYPNAYTTNDQSAMDMSYFPQDYPVLKMKGADSSLLLARVIYSRPQQKAG